RMNILKKDPLYQNEMQGYTDVYLDYIKEVAMSFPGAPFVTAEKQVSFESYAPGGFGTSDCIIIGGNTMYVCDFKYGKGVKVDAERNTQGMLYALGALKAYEMFYRIDEIVIAIIQPRIDNISEYRISAAELTKWADEVLKPAVKEVLDGSTDCNPGPWCDKGFCKARCKCRALAEAHLELLDDYGLTDAAKLNNAQIGDVLTRGRQLKAWLAAVDEYALSECLAGREVPGWKVVAGRSVRQFTDTDKAFEHFIGNGIKRDMLYKRVPITLTEAEKLIGKKQFAKMADGFITKSVPKPTLAEASDKREEYKPNSAANDFADVI
ncbi:MAG: DUF2800 domain-containing protein, partial [Candidatus Ornithomonoglobus sp.]